MSEEYVFILQNLNYLHSINYFSMNGKNITCYELFELKICKGRKQIFK